MFGSLLHLRLTPIPIVPYGLPVNRPVVPFTLLALYVLICLPTQAQNWGQPIWADEFNGAANSTIDSTKWTYDTGKLNVNDELEIYCAPATATAPCDPANPNAFIDGAGHLVIQHRLVGSS